MKAFIFHFVLNLLLCTLLLSQSEKIKHHAQAPLDCRECHSCNNPTYKNPCLKIFPDFKREGLTIHHSAADAPELFTIDTLSKIYEPSIFTHKLHAEMSAMSGGCASCHHHNPPGRILACIDCHEPSLKRTDLGRPGLKGAYHRQCLNCHREWSQTTNCIVCHAVKGSQQIEDKSEFIGKSHPEVSVPSKLVYQTDEEDNPIVTFFHDDHSRLFGLKCVDCHKNESCSRCHDTMKKAAVVEKEAHENCVDCHESEVNDNCTKCHDIKEKAHFNHASVGWKLNKYHKSLNCQTCHISAKFTKLNKRCTACHKSWKSGVFDHKVTGLVLDEDHEENECADCHENLNFAKRPTCDECHDDYSYPTQKPGTLLRK